MLLIAATLAMAGIIAAWVIAATGMGVEPAGFVRFLALAAAMLLLSMWCLWRYPDPRLSRAAAIVGLGTLSLMLCGIISNAGLGLRAPLIDPALVAIDAALGLDVEMIVRSLAKHRALIEALAAVYNASGGAVVALIAIAAMTRPAARAWELTGTVILAMQLVAVLSIAMPAIGAMAYLGMEDLQGQGLPRGAGVYHLEAFGHFRAGAPVLRLPELSGLVTFPSFHTVLALLASQALWETRWRWPGIAWTSTVIVSTVPIGGHYAADLVAGFLVWLVAALTARRFSSPSA